MKTAVLNNFSRMGGGKTVASTAKLAGGASSKLMHRLGHALPIILFSAASVLCAKDAAAKGYPDHPITVVVPDGAGGAAERLPVLG